MYSGVEINLNFMGAHRSSYTVCQHFTIPYHFLVVLKKGEYKYKNRNEP